MSADRKPLVSIITVTYNSEKYIRQTIASVLKQSYPKIEYILIDGGSTDATLAIIKESECLFNGRMKWISEKDAGIYDAMNKGITMADGEIIGIINSDDYYAEDIITEVVDRINDYDLLHGILRFVDEKGIKVKSYAHKKGTLRKYLSTPFNHPTMFVKKKVYEYLGGFNTIYRTAADYDFMLRFVKSGLKDVYLDKTIATMRTVGVTSSMSAGINYNEVKAVLQSNGVNAVFTYLLVLFRVVRSRLYQVIKKRTGLIRMIRRFSGYHTNH